MKKVLTYLLAVVLGVACCFTFIGCGDKTVDTGIDAKIKEAQGLTTEQLVEKAKAETGAFVAYGNTSRITDAMTNFVKEYGEKIGLTDSNASAAKKTDSEIYQILMTEAMASNNSGNASMVLIQDSATLDLYRGNANILSNYIPKGMEEFVDEANRVPLAHQFINKLFMYNNMDADNSLKFDNVWELTKSEHQGDIYFKNPKDEQVNMNFLIMLTSDEWADRLEAAYKSFNDNAAATDVGADKTYKNYGYKWVAEFLKNCNFSITSDTKIASSLSKDTNQGKLGLFVLSKLRDSSVESDHLQVSAWDKKESSEEFVEIDPFAGFMYSIYAQLATKAPRPYTAMLFTNYLMTEAGFKPWATMGGYSSASNVPVTTGDQPLSFWQKTLVIENGSYIRSVKAQASDWIIKQIPSA